jgi:hypothetical protein
MPEYFSLCGQTQKMDFAVTIKLRDSKGNPTNKTKTFESMTGAGLCEWYERNAFRNYGKSKDGGKKKPSKKTTNLNHQKRK